MMKLYLKLDRKIQLSSGVCLGILLLITLFFHFSGAVQAKENVIRVGFVGSGGVVEDENGDHSGYTVDYLEGIAEYTGWEYEYIHADWTDCIEMLKNGELDLMGMVRHTDARDDFLLFSELAMASDYTVLCAAVDSNIYYQEYEAIDSCTVGVMENSVYEEAFLAYAKKYGLDCNLKRFRSVNEAEEALFKGEIDLLATTRLARPAGTRLIDQFQVSPAYFVTGVQNQSLMNELNDAMQLLSMENGMMEAQLKKKHYDTDQMNLPLTREEREYLKSVKTIIVKGTEKQRPMGYWDESGRGRGILVDYLNSLGFFTDLNFIYEETEFRSLEENAGSLEDGSVLLCIGPPLEDPELDEKVYKSEPLFQSNLSYIRRQEDVYVRGRHNLVFALNREMSYLEELLYEKSKYYEVRYYDTAMECMNAVMNGDADITVQDGYVASYMLQKPVFADKLTIVRGDEYVQNVYLYVPEEHLPLLSILNKTINGLSEEERTSFIANAVLAHSYEYELGDFLYVNVSWIRSFVILVIMVIILCILLNMRINQSKKQRKENAKLRQKIYLDELTGIYNRNGFFEKARELIDRSGDDIYIVRINICHFRLINEMYGIEKGDHLLKAMGKGLKGMGIEKNFVAGRFSSDYFYLCIRREDFENSSFPARVPSAWLGMDITFTYGVYPVGQQKDMSVNAMCDRADMANSANKHSLTEYIHYYSDCERQRQLREKEIENEMENAIAEHQFIIYIQPKYDITTEQVVGGEALVRWLHPRKGMIPPGRFIDLFEKNGFVRDLDYYVWDECCHFLSDMKKKGLPMYPLSMNVSRIHFYSGGMKEKLAELLEKYDLNAGDLELEITETIYAEDTEIVFSQCRELQDMGFKIAMDDFGSGYSCLNMLKDMPLDIIKMDMRFLSGGYDEAQVEKGRNILRSLIEMVHNLELKVVVEGVETREQKEFIRQIGNCYVQGYYFSKPLDVQSYESLIETDLGNVGL